MFQTLKDALNQFRYEGDRLGFVSSLRDSGHDIERFVFANSVAIFSPELVRDVLTNTKAFAGRNFIGALTNEAGMENWMKCRKWTADLLSARGLSSSQWASRSALLARARTYIQPGASVDILNSAIKYCMETSGKLSFGNADSQVMPYFPELLAILLLIVGRGYSLNAPWQRKHISALSKKSEACLDAISRLLSEKLCDAGSISHHLQGLEEVPIRDRAMYLLSINLAGHSVPAGPIAWTTFFVESDQNVKDRLIEELNQPNDKSAYLAACIREAIRLMPPSWLIERQLVNRSAITVALPDNVSSVYISPYAIGRSPQLFDRPDVFDPLRHLSGGCPHTFAFGAGPRACIGQVLTFLEAQEYLACLYRENFVRLAVRPEKVVPDSTLTLLPMGLLLDIQAAG